MRTKSKWRCPKCFFSFSMGKSSTSLWATGPSSSSFVTVAVVLNFQDQFKISLQEQLFIICLTPGSISKLPYIFPCPFFVQAFNLCVATQKKVKQSAHPQKSEIRVHGRWKNLWRKWKLRSTIPRRWKKRCMAMGWKVKLGEFGWGPGGMGIFTEKGTWII